VHCVRPSCLASISKKLIIKNTGLFSSTGLPTNSTKQTKTDPVFTEKSPGTQLKGMPGDSLDHDTKPLPINYMAK
jgi:hypothetical protein